MGLTNILLLCMCLFGIGHTVYTQVADVDGITINEISRNAILLVAGVGGLLINNAGAIFDMLPNRGGKKKNDTDILNIDDNENLDFQCLIRLRERLKEVDNSDGVDICAKLADMLFRGGFRKNDKGSK